VFAVSGLVMLGVAALYCALVRETVIDASALLTTCSCSLSLSLCFPDGVYVPAALWNATLRISARAGVGIRG